MIPKPLERLTHAPQFPEFDEDQLQGFVNASVWMKYHLAHFVQHIANRKPLEKLTAACFRFLTSLHSLPQNLQFNDAQRPLNTEYKLIVQRIQVIDLLLISDQGSENLTDLE